ncbi:hypothetical protein [Azospirillum picis]|uniref:Uncharacterized protein n=1 Tax=Azospirillum picis TaxID=488438 RepID=A0ABU0MLS4_9PROT|nr:hypothetical protein [Azospirillum picis]MBP2300962.1 hypothetical protein [Azospirillum picis]MDQ0534418.1 hypothetical protein [Azospirillum picis]
MPTMPSRRPAAPMRERFQDLQMPEALMVSVLRLWTEPLRDPERPHPHWQDGLMDAGLSNDAAVAFDTLMRIAIAACTRPLDIHRPPCPALGADEALLLDMLRLAQGGRHGEAGLLMSGWLPLAGVRMAMAPLCILATALSRAGLPLPEPAAGSMAGSPTKAMERPRATADRGASLLH